jgi:hypothetical protein
VALRAVADDYASAVTVRDRTYCDGGALAEPESFTLRMEKCRGISALLTRATISEPGPTTKLGGVTRLHP